MSENYSAMYVQLRLWRALGFAALLLVPSLPLGLVVLVELGHVPKSAHVLESFPLTLLFLAARRLASLKCPDCGRSFSIHERTGTHLTNKRCVFCGFAPTPSR